MNIKRTIIVIVSIGFLFSLSIMVNKNVYGQSRITLKYANFPPATTFPCVQMERWAKEVEKRTNGKVKVQTFPGGTLIPAKNIFDGVISGMADIGNFAMSYQPGRFPVSEAIDLPVGFTSARSASLALYDLIQKYQPKEFQKVKLLTVFTCPPADLMTTRQVKTLTDLKGMELRVSGTGADVITRLGGVPIAMPQSDTPEAIQKGVVKGIVSSTEILKDFNFAVYCPYVAKASLFVVSFAVVMNKDKWNSLPEDAKKVIDDLRREQAEWTGTYADERSQMALDWTKQTNKDYQLTLFSAADKAVISKALKPMIDDYVKKVNGMGLPGDQIIKDVYALKAKHEKGK